MLRELGFKKVEVIEEEEEMIGVISYNEKKGMIFDFVFINNEIEEDLQMFLRGLIKQKGH